MMLDQPLSAKRAETRMPAYGDRLAQDSALSAIHRDRAERFRRSLDWLLERHVLLDPFLEIGAGVAQRSLVLRNDFRANGIATDINGGSLHDSLTIQRMLGFDDRPLLIVCDATCLPFRPNTFQFVFAFQMLHRFPEPGSVMREAYRVLGRGGHFYFDEEPLGSPLRRALRGKRSLQSPPTRLQAMAQRIHLDKVFWDDLGFDRAHAIQVHRPPLAVWQHALGPFGSANWLEANRMLRLRLDGNHALRSTLLSPVAALVGGNIRGLCQKREGETPSGSLIDRVVCPDCGDPLSIAGEPIQCGRCGRVYPSEDGLIRLLPSALEESLYR